MRHPLPHEIEAVNRVRWILSRLGSNQKLQLLWSPPANSYVVAVAYDPRLEGRLPEHVSVTTSPYNPHNPSQVALHPYAQAVPVVLYTAMPAYLDPSMPAISAGHPRGTTRQGTGFGFPQVMFGNAPVIDGTAYATENPSYCAPYTTPDMTDPQAVAFPTVPTFTPQWARRPFPQVPSCGYPSASQDWPS